MKFGRYFEDFYASFCLVTACWMCTLRNLILVKNKMMLHLNLTAICALLAYCGFFGVFPKVKPSKFHYTLAFLTLALCFVAISWTATNFIANPAAIPFAKLLDP